ncbi:MAG: SHOCT domain-containing protein [Actinomycetota bacterium]
MARTAVIAGTASAVSGNVQRRQYERHAGKQDAAEQAAYEAQMVDQNAAQMAAMQQQMAQMQAQQAAAPAAAPAAGGISDDVMTKLTQLAELKNAGVLSDEEFAAAKAKLLA